MYCGKEKSFYYQTLLKDSFYEDPMHPDEKNENKKVYYGVQYSSVTDKSIVIEMLNNTDLDYTLDNSFKLYKVEGKKETLCKEYQGEQKDAVRKISCDTKDSRLILALIGQIPDWFSYLKNLMKKACTCFVAVLYCGKAIFLIQHRSSC